ncbi:hypothetical protein [Leisingera aquimarina]|uniref:hypothetical protein n=1 Tax=Leisingera aquimarina TaxID=476529 RepID=UPI00040EE9B1|nr:hypothetical protein [Leisingera aquimarina]
MTRKTPKELQAEIDKEREEIAENNDFTLLLRKLRLAAGKADISLKFWIEHPERIINSNEVLIDFLHELQSAAFRHPVLSGSEIAFIEQVVESWEPLESITVEDRKALLSYAEKIIAHL